MSGSRVASSRSSFVGRVVRAGSGNTSPPVLTAVPGRLLGAVPVRSPLRDGELDRWADEGGRAAARDTF
ncbi:hypothetical protein V5P93_004142 [Actinokineospora auranticolor]|uniref:Uncharacterized protein n=1 Tax=Actinokineospora auranticolor TaxID=155976 RepID=A0A2S6GIT3_9PSEU|nr:hypothetical protein [Actinokineospora auranticolor]PPK65117.1 hypothetical protein CLV40_116160 [Actinokineospora auranticolor]